MAFGFIPRPWKEGIKALLWRVADAWVCMRSTALDDGTVLVVRVDAIGDFVLWADAARALVDHYHRKGKRVVLAGNALWVQWARDLCGFDEIIPINPRQFRNRPLYRAYTAARLRRRACGIAIHPTFSRDFACGDAIIRISGAAERIGSVGDMNNITPQQKRISDAWYTRLLPAVSDSTMVLRKNAEFIRLLTGMDFPATAPRFPAINKDTIGAGLLSTLGAAPYYALFPGASTPAKRWPARNFARIAELVYEQTGWQGIICGDASESEIAARLTAETPAPLTDLTGQTTLHELSYVLSRAQFLVSNDTVAVHIAAAHQTPSVTILGGWHFGQFLPYELEEKPATPLPIIAFHPMDCFRCNWHCPYHVGDGDPKPCVDRVTVEQVWTKVHELCTPTLKEERSN